MDQEAIDNLERVLQRFIDQFNDACSRMETVAQRMSSTASRMEEAAGMAYMAGRSNAVS